MTWPNCRGKMRVIAFIEDPHGIKKILKQLNLWVFKKSPRPVAHGPQMIESTYGYSLQPSADDDVADPIYPTDMYFPALRCRTVPKSV